jgi:hypothetical protein
MRISIMKRCLSYILAGFVMCTTWTGSTDGRGFGGFRGGYGGGFHYGGYGGGFHYGGYHAGGYGGGWSGSRSGSFGGSYSGSRSFSGYSGHRGGWGSGSYDRSFSDARGGSMNAEGSRSYYRGPYGGGAAGGTRTISGTTAGGQSFSHTVNRGAAYGPGGRYVGGSSHYGSTTGPRGSASGSWQSAFSGRAFPTDFGVAHYGGVAAVGGHGTAYWSHGYMGTRAGYVRGGFGYYNCFHHDWFAAHTGCWFPAAWTGAAAWATVSWANLANFCGLAGGIDSIPADYDYGSNIVYQNGNVYDGGQQIATAPEYAQQATTLANEGQTASAPTTEEWKALGVFAMVQGEETTSNDIFELAINKSGIIRGNYYDGLMDTTTQVYGALDKKNQRAAWTIGKDNKRVFETGIGNLTKDEAPVLVHFGPQKTQQWLLVRVKQQSESK